MSTDAKNKFNAGRWAIGVVAVLVLYVFSYAPVKALTMKYQMSHPLPRTVYEAQDVIYAPMSCIKHTPFFSVFVRYQVWWWNTLNVGVCMPLP